jgi:hypothetical protein
VHLLPHQPRVAAVVTMAALLVAGCSGSTASSHANGEAHTATPSAAETASAKQRYLDRVNALCDALLPQVIRVTHGGSIDVPARQYLRDWPAHRRVLAAFDASVADVPVPPAAAPAARAMRHYVEFADTLDSTRLEAAQRGERAWQREVAAEADVESAPSIAARNAAGFAASCDAR